MSYQLEIEGTYNIRDLGDYPVKGGNTTCRHILVRAGNLDQVPLSSQQQLKDYGVKTVIDLRDEWEVQQFPNVFVQSKTIKYLNLPLIGNHFSNSKGWKEETQDYDGLDELYCKYLDHCQIQIGTIISTIAESMPTIVFHCYAGKDRTGIIAALLLGSVGVPDHLIAKDYSLSNLKITHLIEQWREYALQHGQDMQRFERDVGSEVTTMLNMLGYIKHRYGSVTDYLRVCGVTDIQLLQLQTLMIQSET